VAARTYIKKTRQLIVEGDFEAADQMAKKAVSTLDKAASKNILHRRNTSRRKSRLMKALATARKSAAD
jgi:small subunit ribosomal protein S20